MGATLGKGKKADVALSAAAARIIELACKVYDYYDSEMPKWHPNYPLVEPDAPDPPPPPEEGQLRSFLASLPGETIDQLRLLVELGHHRFAVDDMARAYEALIEESGGTEYEVSQLMFNAGLENDLSNGLEELRKHGIDPDRLPLKKAKPRKR